MGQQRGGPPQSRSSNYTGRYSYDPRGNPIDFNQPPPSRPNYGHQNMHNDHHQRGGQRQPYAGRFSYDQRNIHDEQQWENQA